MNRSFRRIATFASLAGALAVLPAVAAYAHDGASTGDAEGHRHGSGRRAGLLGAALKLDSLTADQRSAIEGLLAQRKAASVPVRQADAQVLTVLAQQVEQAKVDPQGLASSLGVEQGAVTAETAVDRDTLNKLHTLLTGAQRNQLADRLKSAHHEPNGPQGAHAHGEPRFGRDLNLTQDQRAAIAANLRGEQGSGAAPASNHHALVEAFRADSFDATGFVQAHAPGQRIEKLAAAMVPVLSPAQRATFAGHLRAKAAHEAGAHG
jgi:Spy/CpxP family protein refolding chaperone